eukprot:TRINITY_DN4418_c0_g1_i2.p1 TRINITY_DN4418_c0_g1~~TRINITY_DN4418_c0_g1_i2.p1  ORF type:complete len:680 (+),score=101.57 TRINITY_DN4418_c0_g1_i2:120-2159(+)
MSLKACSILLQAACLRRTSVETVPKSFLSGNRPATHLFRLSTNTESIVEEPSEQTVGLLEKEIEKNIQLENVEKTFCEQKTDTKRGELGLRFDHAEVEIEHPWPEWIAFMQRLAEMNYFQISTSFVDKETCASSSPKNIFKDLNTVRNACLSFGRDRYDILRSLSMDEIKLIMEHGCPSVDRKVVNSGKRLRAYVSLDEGEVCSKCSIRHSCDRAFVKPREDDDVRTVDIMRILLTYGLDPVLNVAENKTESVKESVCNLLREVVELSKTPVDPNFPKPMPKQPPMRRMPILPSSPRRHVAVDVERKKGDWHCQMCNTLNFARNSSCINCRQRRPKEQLDAGEWECPRCQYVNFRRNVTCLKCTYKPKEGDNSQNFNASQWFNHGDWRCPECNFMNFRRNSSCIRCDCRRPENNYNQRTEKNSDFLRQDPGDWNCPECNFLNFRRNNICLRCQFKPNKDNDWNSARQLNLGDWNCPECNFLNFRRNTECRRCKYRPDKDAKRGKSSDDSIDEYSFEFDDFPVSGGQKTAVNNDTKGFRQRGSRKNEALHSSRDKHLEPSISDLEVDDKGTAMLSEDSEDDGWFGSSRSRGLKVNQSSFSRRKQASTSVGQTSTSDSDVDFFSSKDENVDISGSKQAQVARLLKHEGTSHSTSSEDEESDGLLDFNDFKEHRRRTKNGSR